MQRPDVISARAEASIALLFETLAIHRQRSVRSGTLSPRLSVMSRGGDPEQPYRQLTLLRLVSITEAFCADQLYELGEIHVRPSETPARASIWDRAADDALGSWPKIRASYKAWFSITPPWGAIEDLIEVRNAIAHGLGHLTRRQRKSEQSTRDKISRAGIRLDGDRVILEEVDLTTAARTCRELIQALDTEIERVRDGV